MGTLNDDLTEIKKVEDTLTKNKVSRFAYTKKAYTDNDADGVDSYDFEKEQNIPDGTASTMKVNQTVIDKGYRAQASSITRMLLNHFLGRLSYNLNKVNDNMSSLLATLQSHLGKANGIASLDENGRVPYSQLPESAMELKGEWDASTNTPELVDGTGTNGDFYVVTVAGTQTFGGKTIKFQVNDRILYNGSTSTWIRLQSGGVYSVCNRTPNFNGNVNIYPMDIRAITNINGKNAEYPTVDPTKGYVTLTATDVGAVAMINGKFPDRASGEVNLTATDVGAVAMINGKFPDRASGEVNLTATNVGAVAMINGKFPDRASGEVNLTATNVGAVASVNGKFPDRASGEVNLTATNVGAVASVNGKSPDAEGNVVIDALSVDAVKTVNNKSPDDSGNVNLVATDLPALKTVNGKSATSESDNITLSATDVGAVATVNGESPDSAGNVTLTGSQIDISDVTTTKLEILDSLEMHNMIYGGRDMTTILSDVLRGDADAYRSIFPGDYFSVYQNTTLNTLVFTGFNFARKVNVCSAYPIFALTNKSSVIANVPWANSNSISAVENGYMGSNLYNAAIDIFKTLKTLQGISIADIYSDNEYPSLYLSNKANSSGIIDFTSVQELSAFFPSIIDILGETYKHGISEITTNLMLRMTKIERNTCYAGMLSGKEQLPAFKLNFAQTMSKLRGNGSPIYTRDFIYDEGESLSYIIVFNGDFKTTYFSSAAFSQQMMILIVGKGIISF